MRVFRWIVVLGLAAFGTYKMWELLEPKVSDARRRAADARDKFEPAVRDAADTLQTASREAAQTLAEASHDLAVGKPADQSVPGALSSHTETLAASPKTST